MNIYAFLPKSPGYIGRFTLTSDKLICGLAAQKMKVTCLTWLSCLSIQHLPEGRGYATRLHTAYISEICHSGEMDLGMRHTR